MRVDHQSGLVAVQWTMISLSGRMSLSEYLDDVGNAPADDDPEALFQHLVHHARLGDGLLNIADPSVKIIVPELVVFHALEQRDHPLLNAGHRRDHFGQFVDLVFHALEALFVGHDVRTS